LEGQHCWRFESNLELQVLQTVSISTWKVRWKCDDFSFSTLLVHFFL